MAETIFAVITVARQIDGEYVFIKTEKAFKKASQADKLLQELKKMYATDSGAVKAVKVTTPNGEAECICEVGAFELELE